MKDSPEENGEVLHRENLLYIPEIIQTKLISRYNENLLAGDFCIKKTRESITRKYYWPMLRVDIKSYIKASNVCLGLKLVKHEFYSDLQSPSVSMH